MTTVTEPTPPWWRRKRWQVAAVLAVLFGYPLSFVPACWILVRLDPKTRSAQWAILREAYRPAATVLTTCPDDLQAAVCTAANLGSADDAALVASGGRIGVRTRETDGGRDTVVIRWVW